MRECSLSSSDLILMKSPRDQTICHSLGKQLFPGQGYSFCKLFQEATKEPFSYLHVCLSQTCPDFLRLRARILPEEAPAICYVPKDKLENLKKSGIKRKSFSP
jgi:hypothetical protein